MVSCRGGLISQVVSSSGGLISQVVSCRGGLISQVVSCRSGLISQVVSCRGGLISQVVSCRGGLISQVVSQRGDRIKHGPQYHKQGNSVVRDLPPTGSEANTTILFSYILDIDSYCPYLLFGETTSH